MDDLTEDISEKDRTECGLGISMIIPPDWMITTRTQDYFVVIPQKCVDAHPYDDSMSITVANKPAPKFEPGSTQAKELTYGRLLGQECIIREVDLEPEFPHPGYYTKSFYVNCAGIPRGVTYHSTQFGKPRIPESVMQMLESIRCDG